jgi:cysteine synthase A
MVSEADAVAACRWLARRHGLLVGGSTGSVIAGALLHRRSDRKGRRPMIGVGISPDGGEKYLQTIFNDAWVEERFGGAPILKGSAEELEI